MSKIFLMRCGGILVVMFGMSHLGAIHGQTTTQKRGVKGVVKTAPPPASASPIGPYYALIIGNNNYRKLSKLQTAVNDAKSVGQLLHDRFGFQTRTLYNASRADILDALDDYQRTLPEASNLLIYYAGHGHKDVSAGRAYWLPVDAQPDHSPNWINAVEITDKLRAIRSRHILVIADSCWSGDLTMVSLSSSPRPSAKATPGPRAGSVITPHEHDALLAAALSLKSRHIMSSGGDEPVADGGGGGHSVFAGVLLQSLDDMKDDSFTAEALLVQRVKPRVAGRSQQMPEYAVVRDSAADLGDFVFFRSGKHGK